MCLNKKCWLYNTMFKESWNPRQQGRAADKRQWDQASYDRAYEERWGPQRKRSKGQKRKHWWAARMGWTSTARSSTDPAPAQPPVAHMEIVSSEEELEPPQEEWEEDWAEEEDWVDEEPWNAPADDAPLPGAATPPAPAPAQNAPVDDRAIGARHVMIRF
jgi:hypothetical protein